MYLVGQAVVYGSHGVCTVTEIEEKSVDKKMVQYYVLEPQIQKGAKYYVPVHNIAATSKMRLPLTKEEIEEMTASALDLTLWLESENQRKLRYRELINNCDPFALLGMVRLLRMHQAEQSAQGCKFHICDANFLKDAENLLSNEFSYVLNIEKSDAMKLI